MEHIRGTIMQNPTQHYQFKESLHGISPPMSVQILEALTKANLTEHDKARIIAEGFAQMEKRYPDLSNLATRTHLSETELRLIEKIEETKAGVKILEVKLTKEIGETKAEIANTKVEIKNLEVKLTKEIGETKAEIANTKVEIKNLEVKLTREIKEIEVRLTKEIEETKASVKDLDVKLTKEIKEIELNITREISKSRDTTIKWMVGLIITQLIAIVGVVLSVAHL